jgi:hypothetical protein
MKRLLLLLLLLFTAHCSLLTANAQGTPGTVRCPSQVDTLDSLFRIKDQARTVLAAEAASNSTTITVTSTTAFPSSGSIKIDDEIIYYSSTTSTTFGTLVRGASGSAAAAHLNSALVTAPILAAHHNTLAQAVICAQQLALGLSAVPTTRTVNNHPLSADVVVTPSDLSLVIGTNVEAYDADLLAIAGLTPANDDVIQRKAGAWINRTPAQMKADLALVKGDVGLGNVVNLDTSTAANIADSTDKRFITDAQRTVLGNTSGANTGDQFGSTAVSRLLGRGSAGGSGAAQEITLGTGLSMSGTTLNASVSGLPSGLAFSSPDFTVATGAANQAVLSGSTTTNPVKLVATGSDASIPISFAYKGTGGIIIDGGAQGTNTLTVVSGTLQSNNTIGSAVDVNWGNGWGKLSGTNPNLVIGTAGNADLTLDPGGTGGIIFAATVQLAAYTVLTLPTGVAGMKAYVTDGDSGLAWGATVIHSGGGATKYLVWFNGTNWTVVGK